MQVHGKEILGLPFGNNKIERYCCDFNITEENHDFVIDVDGYPIEKACELVFRNEAIHSEYMFCRDENDQAFTIYDCYIMPMQIPVKQMKIIWNKCLWGYHIENFQDEKVISAKYIVQTDKKRYPFHMFVGKNDFELMDGKVCISTDWNQENFKFEGVAISVCLKDALSIDEVEKIILRMLEIFSLQIGFFPKIESRTMTTQDQKKFWFMEDFAAYGKTAKSNIKLDYILYTKTDSDFSKVYDKWWKLREKEVVTFNLFSYLTTDSSPVREVPIATCIQCLEGYFRIHHSEEMFRFSRTAKNQIKKEVFKALDSSDSLKKICEENGIEYEDIRESFNRMSGHINEYSLRDILRYAIERYNSTKLLFQYEKERKINEKISMMDLFIQKATGHRNWLSHLTEQPNRFTTEELKLADEKFRMLFRLTLLCDIGIEVTDDSLNAVIQRINQWYKNNDLLCSQRSNIST